jgi:hypothetical protein
MSRFVMLTLLLTGCPLQETTVPTGPNTTYPCGVNGVVCTVQQSCCNEGETCGGEPASVGCPAGMCCDINNSQNFSKKPPRKQRPIGDGGL